MPFRIPKVNKTGLFAFVHSVSSLIIFFQLLDSFDVHSHVSDSQIVVMEVLPKHYVLLDGLHRTCAHFVQVVLESGCKPEDVNFQVEARVMWPSL